MMKKTVAALLLLLCLCPLTACEKESSAASNTKMTEAAPQPNTAPQPVAQKTQPQSEPAVSGQTPQGTYWIPLANGTSAQAQNVTAVVKINSLYDCDIQADRELYTGAPDIVVGDNFFATQINDWYANPALYVGKTVEIEGFYINEFAPYEFIGRYGPTCQYCQGGYVCYEILTDADMTDVTPISDWIKLTGILRTGMDADSGSFGYIEALKIEVMPQPGMATITN